ACMAASFTTLVGHPNALAKSNPTHPRPRFFGSTTGLPCRTTPGYPIDTREYFHPSIDCRTRLTSLLGVNVGPDGIFTTVLRPVARSLILVPPTSMTRTPMSQAPTGFSTSAPNRYRILLLLRVSRRGRSFGVICLSNGCGLAEGPLHMTTHG